MDPNAWIDIVRKGAYPIDAPEGEEYEREVVRKMLEAIARIKAAKDPMKPLLIPAMRDEARAVFEACMKASGF